MAYEKLYCDVMDDFDKLQNELNHVQTLALDDNSRYKELAQTLADVIGISYDIANGAISFQSEVIEDGMPDD